MLRRRGEAMGAAADVEASGEDAFGGDAAVGALLHGLPEGEDAGFGFSLREIATVRRAWLRAVDGVGSLRRATSLASRVRRW